jgi:hypothetical protein
LGEDLILKLSNLSKLSLLNGFVLYSMSNPPSQQELTDLELAKKLQEEWNKEESQPTNQDPQKKVI